MGASPKENSKWEDADISLVGPHIHLSQAFSVVSSLKVPWREEFRSQIEPISVFEILRQVNLHIFFKNL